MEHKQGVVSQIGTKVALLFEESLILCAKQSRGEYLVEIDNTWQLEAVVRRYKELDEPKKCMNSLRRAPCHGEQPFLTW